MKQMFTTNINHDMVDAGGAKEISGKDAEQCPQRSHGSPGHDEEVFFTPYFHNDACTGFGPCGERQPVSRPFLFGATRLYAAYGVNGYETGRHVTRGASCRV